MNRREFLASLGALAGAVALNGVPLPDGPAEQSIGELFRIGDVLTIEGRYALNPVTQQPTAHLMQFVITAVDEDSATIHPTGLIDRRNRRKAKLLGMR